jgi:AbrB family looped-hinge helix DNA binding protein
MSNTSILSPKFQTVIPKGIRRELNLKPGQEIEFSIEGDHIVVRPLLHPSELIGYLREDKPLDFEREADRNLK